MKFLEQAASYLYAHHRDALRETVVVLPSRRAGLFLKKYLSQQTTKPIFAPAIYSIEDFVFSLSGFRKMEPAYLPIEFYQVYREREGDKAVPFKEFVKWGEVVIADFNETDLYMVDPDELFGFLSDAKAIALWNLDEQPLTPFEARYLAFFNSLSGLYKDFSAHLLKKGAVYPGLAYRDLAMKLEGGEIALPWEHLLFVGFNALTAAEERIMKVLHAQYGATLLWDADTYYLEDNVQEAGKFLRHNRRQFKLEQLEWTSDHLKTGKKTVHLIGVPRNVGQAKVAGQVLADAGSEAEGMEDTSIVLNDESLLFPVLNSLPDEVKTFNLTMGLPLDRTVLHTLIDDLIRLNENALKFDRSAGSAPKLYFRDLLRVLEHPYFHRLASGEHSELQKALSRVRNGNQVFYNQKDRDELFAGFSKGPGQFARDLFTPWGDSAGMAIDAIQRLLKKLKAVIQEEGEADNTIHMEYLFHFSMLFNRLKTAIGKYPFLSDLDSFRHVFQQMVRSLDIPFYGEPLRGVQVMGMLETRTLDFRKVIMLSVNEDFLPGKGLTNSFIPYEIKRKFGLPTHRERNAVSAYHFYRLLQRAEEVYLLYNTEPGDLGGGDRSRFITQLEHELVGANPRIELKPSVLSLTPSGQGTGDEVRIIKTPDIMERIHRQAERGFSASAVNTFRTCSLKYYFRYILGVAEAGEVEEVMEASTFGNVVHDALCALYLPLKGKPLSAGDYDALNARVGKALEHAFMENYPRGDLSTGKNLLIARVAGSFINRLLRLEKAWLEEGGKSGAGLVISGLEEELSMPFAPEELKGKGINIRGVVDRVDRFAGTTRIIDYKTGKVEPYELKLKEWDALLSPGRYEKLFQVLYYAYLYLGRNGQGSLPVTAGILSFRNLANGFLPAVLPGSVPLDEGMAGFEGVLSSLFSSLYDADVPFGQVTDTRVCEFCAYRSVCRR